MVSLILSGGYAKERDSGVVGNIDPQWSVTYLMEGAKLSLYSD